MAMSIRLTKVDKIILERLVEEGFYLNASEALRAGIRVLDEKCKAQKAES